MPCPRKKVIEYIITSSFSVNRFLKRDFKLYGNPFINEKGITCQAMVKYEIITDKKVHSHAGGLI